MPPHNDDPARSAFHETVIPSGTHSVRMSFPLPLKSPVQGVAWGRLASSPGLDGLMSALMIISSRSRRSVLLCASIRAAARDAGEPTGKLPGFGAESVAGNSGFFC
jgi:hypothetical protein